MEHDSFSHVKTPGCTKRFSVHGLRCKSLCFMLMLLVSCVSGLAMDLEVGLLQSNERRDDTLSALKALRTEYQLPALAIGQGMPGKFAVESVGVRKEGNSKPALTTDVYHLGSNTKAMTASILALLVQDGQFSWTSTLPELLPGFKISPSHHSTTLEMLTAHRSGITDDYIKNLTFTASLYGMSALEGRWAVSNHSLIRPSSQKQGTYNYANTNYILAGLVIDIATKSSAEDVFRSRLFKPLSITTAGFGPCPETSDTSIDNPWPHYSTSAGPVPYSQVPNSQRDNPPALNTAGRVHIAPRDYNSFLQVHLAGAMHPQTKNTLKLNAASFNKLHQPYPETNTSSPGYGYTYGGWLRRNYTEEGTSFTLIHDGSNKLNFAVALLDTYYDEAYIALTNVGGTEAEVATVEAVLAMRNGTLALL